MKDCVARSAEGAETRKSKGSASLFSFTRHGYLWRVRYRDPVGMKWVFAWTRCGALRLARGHGIVSADRVSRPKGKPRA